jgi:uncharacterized protein YkwD
MVLSKRRIWYLVVLCLVLASLAGQTGVLADPAESPALVGYALGAHAPREQTGYVEYLPDAPAATVLDQPDGACDWASTFEDQVVCLINEERLARGLYPCKVSPILAAAAEQHSEYMRDHDCFDHQCPGEPSPADRVCTAGYRSYCWGSCFVGETLGGGFPSAASVVAAWMGSSGHRAILLHGQMREIGAGYVSGGYWGHYWSVDFGSQPDVLPVFINHEQPETADPQVTLTLTNEEVSGCSGIDYASQVMISNDPGFAGAQWDSFSAQRPWRLNEENGIGTVYVKYRDPTGYEVTSCDVIALNIPRIYDLQLSSNSVTFLYQVGVGFATPASNEVSVSNSAGGSPMSWAVDGGGSVNWLAVAPADGTTPGNMLISVAGFETTTPGTYQANITVTSAEDPDNPEVVMVTVKAVEQLRRVMLPLVAKEP